MKRNEAIKFVILRTIGNFLVLFSLFGVIATFGPALYFEAQYQIIQLRGIHFKVESQKEIQKQGFADIPRVGDLNSAEVKAHNPGFSDILAGAKDQILVPSDTNFSIAIPKIGASAKVYPNVDPTNSSEFLPILQKGIAHAKGSVFPGFNGNVYLFAHSTDAWWNVGRYNAVFYLLKNLEQGDAITVFFENRRFDYVVDKIVIVDPENTSLIAGTQTGRQQLVLQTCWPPGTTWKRLDVIAVPKKI
jgi:sortase A